MRLTAIINWLNDEPQPMVLQRDGVYALLSWRDFNPQQEEAAMPFRTAAWIFLLGAGVQALLAS